MVSLASVPSSDGRCDNDHDHGHEEKIAEAPLSMLVPIIVVAVALVVLGLYSGDIVTHIIQSAIPGGIA